MRPYAALILPILAIVSITQGQEGYWQQSVHYKMDLTLQPEEHELQGEEIIEYSNHSPDTLRQFYMHLYPNAFRDNQTIRAREARKFYRSLVPRVEDGGYLDIKSFRISSYGNEEESPLTAFKIDDTILSAQLPKPLPPGGKIKVELSFYLKIRKFSGRAGYRAKQYDFAQWYPKVCVYDETGWNAEPFHLLGEFYGEFGTFDVTIKAPYKYIIGATGIVVEGDPGWSLVEVDTALTDEEWQKTWKKRKELLSEKSGENDIRSVKFHAENVHDFAWLASPDFLYERGEWDGIPIHVLYRSGVKNKWSKTVAERAARSLAWLSEKFGRYPYPQVTVTHGLLGGGMEYPMLVMNASESEGLILHEIGHIYFFGILANNEWKEAWMDEGFTSFQTRWYMETRYGDWGFNYDEWREDATWLQRRRPRKTSLGLNRDRALAYMNSGHNEPVSRISYQFNDGAGYGVNAYTKGRFIFEMLKYVVGDSTFEKICHTYFDRWKFKHVTEARFQQVCEDVSGKKLGWFFEQWLDDSITVDYALADVKKQKSGDTWETEAQITRKEKGVMPVEVQLVTETGDTLVKRWNGVAKTGSVKFTTDSPPKQVTLDPRDAILDNSLFNNGSKRTEFMFEYPNLNYNPRNAYVITWRPSGWYNNVDKVRVGGRIKAIQEANKQLELGIWYGTDSQELDGRLSYSRPIQALGANTRGALSAQKLEGRFEIDANLRFMMSKNLTSASRHNFLVGFSHSQLVGDNDSLYTLRQLDQKNNVIIQTWQDGVVNKLYGRYSFNPRGMKWFTNLTFGIETVQADWGSDFTYSTAYSEIKFWAPKPDEGVFFRLFGQTIGDSSPIQDKIFLDGANPRQRFRRFYLRSNGSIPTALHYHLPGGGNVRGYFNNPAVGNEVLAVNFELRKRITQKTVDRFLHRFLGRKTVVLFFDAASMDLFEVEVFADAGVGLRFRNILPDDWYTLFTNGRNVTLRLDFPLWVNKPLPEENHFQFRWLLGFESTF